MRSRSRTARRPSLPGTVEQTGRLPGRRGRSRRRRAGHGRRSFIRHRGAPRRAAGAARAASDLDSGTWQHSRLAMARTCWQAVETRLGGPQPGRDRRSCSRPTPNTIGQPFGEPLSRRQRDPRPAGTRSPPTQANVEFDAERVWVSGRPCLPAGMPPTRAGQSGERVRVHGFMTLELADDGLIQRLRQWPVERVVGSGLDLHSTEEARQRMRR